MGWWTALWFDEVGGKVSQPRARAQNGFSLIPILRVYALLIAIDRNRKSLDFETAH